MNEETVKFWIRMFEPRTAKWRAETMRRLKSAKNSDLAAFSIESAEKIEALKRIKSGVA